MEIKEIWGTTKEHQIEFNKVIEQNSPIRKMLAAYRLPSGFPYLRLIYQKVPIVYNCRYSLIMTDRELKFTQNNKFGFFNRAKNINKGIDQKIVVHKITSISRYENPNPFMKIYNINWIQIEFVSEDVKKEMLFCVGGKFMITMRSETNKLYDLLKKDFVGS